MKHGYSGAFFTMRTRFFTTVILLIVVCVILCCCVGDANSSLGKVEIPNQPNHANVRIYVCGAVEREGYYEVEFGADYFEVFSLAGILPESALPSLSSSYVDGSITILIVDFYQDEKRYSSVNANNPLIAARMSVDGLTDAVVNELADYIEEHGKITNKQQLLQALGDDYSDNYYKLFVAEKDYEETD